MASFRAFTAVLLALLFTVVATASAAAGARPVKPVVRLNGEGPQQCWVALVEIKSCTGEIILFFLNGEAYLGPSCCRAIRVIEQSCFAADAMLSAIGFTPEEGNMLKGYCDAGDEEGQHAPPPGRALDCGIAAGGVMLGRKGMVHH